MRHGNHKYLLGVDRAHRKSMMRNLSVSLIEHGKIKTTHAKANAVRIFVEKLVTTAKVDTVENRRLVFSKLNSKIATKSLFDVVAPKFTTRPGGYTRIIKLAGLRVGDASTQCYISFVE